MNLELFTSYGLPGLVIGAILFIVYRLVDRGFTFQVPPSQPRRGTRKR